MEHDAERRDRSEYVNGRTAADMQNERASEPASSSGDDTPRDDEQRTVSLGQRIGRLLRRSSGRHRAVGRPAKVGVLVTVLLLATTACDTGAEDATTAGDTGTGELSQLAGTYDATVSEVRLVVGPDDAEVRVEDGQLVFEYDDGGSEQPIREATEVACDDSGCSWESIVGPSFMIMVPADADGAPFRIVRGDGARSGEQPHSGGICGTHPDLPEDAWTTQQLGSDQLTYTGVIGGGSDTCAAYTVELTPAS